MMQTLDKQSNFIKEKREDNDFSSLVKNNSRFMLLEFNQMNTYRYLCEKKIITI